MLLSLGSVGAHRALAVPAVLANELPYSSPVLFKILDPISSSNSRANDIIRLQLDRPLVIGTHTIAPTGTPGSLRILDATAASSGDAFGYVDVYFEPLVLPNGQRLPLLAPEARLQIHPTAGHQSTVGVEDAIENEIIPYHLLYQIFRKGKNFELRPGAIVRARTQAVVMLAAGGALTIATPPPMPVAVGTPFASFPTIPMATPASFKERPPMMTPTPMGAPTAPPMRELFTPIPTIAPGEPGGPGGMPSPPA